MADATRPQKVHEILRSRREQRHSTLQAIHQETRISLDYLEALESGDHSAFPAEVYYIGFLRRYSAYLGLNPEEMLQFYKEEVKSIQAEQNIQEQRDKFIQRQEKSANLNRMIILVLFMASLGGFWLYTIVKAPDGAAAPAPAAVRASKGEAADVGSLSFRIHATNRVWMRIASDDDLVFEGYMSSGTVRSWEARSSIFLRIGDVRFIQLVLNGRSIDPREGAVRNVNEILLTRETLLDES